MEHEWPWLQAIRRMTGAHDLFVYKHRIHGSFVLCQWIDKSQWTFNELETFYGSPTAMWPEDLPPLEILRHTLKYAEQVYQDRIKIRNEIRSMNDTMEYETEVEKGETVKYLKKRRLDQAAHELEVGITPYVAPSQSQIPDRDEVVKDLVKIVRDN